ncbi:hypothetical protein DY000_02020115 [Brassica cretica]|uniref:Uncharacterized protein n=1 Tax=Brassica cretica TaxID=69181 RepID=A0ABQ7EJE5_BRACR|nr:hypothetical protein DY000_02020115 [Brassica cretica]
MLLSSAPAPPPPSSPPDSPASTSPCSASLLPGNLSPSALLPPAPPFSSISWPSTPTTAPETSVGNVAEEARTTLVAAVNDFPVDILYLDNTYTFPSRHVAANLIAHIILSHPSHDIVIGVDSLGKEHLLVHLSRILNIKIWVWPERLRTMHLLGFQDIFTTDKKRRALIQVKCAKISDVY